MQSTTHHCLKCSRPDSADDMVACDVCDAWIHYQCAGVTESISGEDRSFRCETCKANEKAKDDVRSQARGSVHSSRSSRRSSRVQLALQKLEEERALKLKQLEEEEAARRKKEEEEEIVRKKKHEQEEESRRRRAEEEEKYLKQKYDLLIAEADSTDDGGSRRSRVSSRLSQERVREWLSSEKQSNPIGKDGVNLVPGCSSSNTAPPAVVTVQQNPAPAYGNPDSAVSTLVGKIYRPSLPSAEAMIQGKFGSTSSTQIRPNDPAPCTVAPIVNESLVGPISPGELAALTQSGFEFSSPAILSSTTVRRPGGNPIVLTNPALSTGLPVTTVASGSNTNPPVCLALQLFRQPISTVSTSIVSIVTMSSNQPRIPSYWELLELRRHPAPVPRTSELRPDYPEYSSEQRFLEEPAPVVCTQSDERNRPPVRTLPQTTASYSWPSITSSVPVYSSDSDRFCIPSYSEALELQRNPSSLVSRANPQRSQYAAYSTSEQRFVGDMAPVYQSRPVPVQNPYWPSSTSAALDTRTNVVQSLYPNPVPLPGRVPSQYPHLVQQQHGDVGAAVSSAYYSSSTESEIPQVSAPDVRMQPPAATQSLPYGGVPRVRQILDPAPGTGLPPNVRMQAPAVTQSFPCGSLPRVGQIIHPAPEFVVSQSSAPNVHMQLPVTTQSVPYGGVPRAHPILDPASEFELPQVSAPDGRLLPPAVTQSFPLGSLPRVHQILDPAPEFELPQVSAQNERMQPPVATQSLPFGSHPRVGQNPYTAAGAGLPQVTAPDAWMPPPVVTQSYPLGGHPRVGSIPNPAPGAGVYTGIRSSIGQPVQQIIAGPSAAQLAARQVMPRELPLFSGEPQDWPLFYSSFCNSTNACGYTDTENLARLQRCLKGEALEAVKSRLLIPESVPFVMDTLQRLFGRSEVLMHSLLNKLRNVPPPKVDNLQSLITFGLAVQNVVDHMWLANLQTHLSNPMLLHELIEKLPSQLKMQWSCYKRAFAEVNLATFGAFMSDLVTVASDVTLPVDHSAAKTGKPKKEKPTLFVHSEQSGGNVGGNKESRPTLPTPPEKRPCLYCSKENHEIATCSQFKGLTLDGKWTAIREKKLCKNCLIPHRKWPCRSVKECGVGGCKVRHHALLHSATKVEREKKETSGESRPAPATGSNVALQNHHYSQAYSLFRYLPVTLESNGKKVSTFAFLDDGSTSTLLEAGIATELGLTGPSEALWLGWTGDISREEKGSQRVSLVISGRGMKQTFKINNVRTVQMLKLPSQSLEYEELQEAYPHLKRLPICSYSEAVPKIIIGLEHVRLLTALKVREGRNVDPVAAKTRLGWCVFGRQSSADESIEQLHFHMEPDTSNTELHALMAKFYAVEEPTAVNRPEADSDKRAREILEATTRRIDDAFETGLLWKHDHPTFPDSYPMAVRRLMALEKRLAKDPPLAAKVKEQVAAYETKGYAHKLTQSELESSDPHRVWYLPLGVVVNERKPGKIRLIWDAAARVNGISFNDLLLKGPDLYTSLPTILLRFRERNIAVCGDIKEMFHQIRIRDPDKQSQRFLWRDSPDQAPQVFVMDVATFGATCSPCSAQFIKNRNASEFAAEYPKASKAIIEGHYVDDYLDSVNTVEEAVQLVSEVKAVHSKAGFEIRNFSSNAPDVLERLGEPPRSESKTMDLDRAGHTERILGMVWQPEKDCFTFDNSMSEEVRKILQCQTVPTKRQVLRTIMSLFDPLGLIAHFIVQGKVLMQNIWRSGSDWDEKITADVHKDWIKWSQLLNELNTVEVPRCFFTGASDEDLSNLQIHVFVDASESAYAAVAFFRIVDRGNPRCALVAAKTKVAPLKPLSIPRLELQAALLGTRLLNDIASSVRLPIQRRFLWSDSSTVLAWLRSDSRRYHQFVAFRVGEILSSTTVNEWRHIPTRMNVADEATKWGSGPSFEPQSRWYIGPNFLREPEDSWPSEPQQQLITDKELRASVSHHVTLPRPLLDPTRFSNWNRMWRATAYVLRSFKLFRKQTIQQPLTQGELLEAENWMWRQAQIETYADEYATLCSQSQHGPAATRLPKGSPLYQLTPFVDDQGVIRMNSRIGAAPTAPFEAKYPIILPSNHRITFLLVDSYHRRYLHCNNETVLNQLRQRFWIPRLRALIKRVAKSCQHCKIYKATPRAPQMAPLPRVRLTPFIRPFTHTGVDYFGPLMVKQGRSLVKRWVCLFTCLTTRAVHVEVARSLSTQSCVMAIRRFAVRRGAPGSFYSDNGTNFVGANNLLEDQKRQIHESCAVTFTNAATNWNFNPPLAPHMGGLWERMVRSIKEAVSAMAEYPYHPSDEVLETVMVEAEGIVNSRPLTYVPIEDSSQPAITPNNFLLYGTEGVNQSAMAAEISGATLRDSWKIAQSLVDRFWQRWIVEYLPTLARRTKWFEPVKPLEPGDVVVVVDQQKRNGWIRGRVLEVVKGSGGQVRRAVVQTANGLITRPAVKIAQLDVLESSEESSAKNPGSPGLHGRGDVDDTLGQAASTVTCVPCDPQH